MLQLGCLKPSS